jgi:hypothetical protein
LVRVFRRRIVGFYLIGGWLRGFVKGQEAPAGAFEAAFVADEEGDIGL